MSRSQDLVRRDCLDVYKRQGYHDKVAFALDCASSEMYDAASQTYYLNGKQRSSEEMIDYMKGLTEKFPFLFVEDMLDENDWDGYRLAHQKIQRTNLIGDDFIITNRKRLERAVRENSLDGFILKPNQVGTISEAMEAYRYARKQGLFAVPDVYKRQGQPCAAVRGQDLPLRRRGGDGGRGYQGSRQGGGEKSESRD